MRISLFVLSRFNIAPLCSLRINQCIIIAYREALIGNLLKNNLVCEVNTFIIIRANHEYHVCGLDSAVMFVIVSII